MNSGDGFPYMIPHERVVVNLQQYMGSTAGTTTERVAVHAAFPSNPLDLIVINSRAA